MRVTENCKLALEALRDRNAARTQRGERVYPVWIDAVCINQNATLERSAQVAMLSQVYRDACQTVAFLGPPDEDARLLFEYQQAKLAEANFKGNVAFALQGICERPWFKRTWVIQELLLAPKCVFLVGAQELSWDIVVETLLLGHRVDLLELRVILYDISKSYSQYTESEDPHRDQMTFRRWRDGTGGALLLDALAGLQSTKRWLSQANEGSMVGGLPSSLLLDLLEATRDFQCRDPRDKIYAILSLFLEPRPLELEPDYRKEVSTVYAEVSWFLLQTGQPFRPHRPREDFSDLPSWTADWRYRDTKSVPFVPFETKYNRILQRMSRSKDTLTIRGCVLRQIGSSDSGPSLAEAFNLEHYIDACPCEGLDGDVIVVFLGFLHGWLLRPSPKGGWILLEGFVAGGDALDQLYAYIRGLPTASEDVAELPLVDFEIH